MTQEMLLKKLDTKKLRKLKAKMIVEALQNGASAKGNHTIELTNSSKLWFFYRGTAIGVAKVDDMEFTPICAGEFDKTPATIRQRKEIRSALSEICWAVS